MPRKLTEKDVEITIECLPEDIPVRGNAMASGDDAADREVEDEILEQLDRGNLWAWCSVVVTAEWRGHVGADQLGGCSYRSEEDFTTPGGYFDDMKAGAIDDLNAKIAMLATDLEVLKEGA